MYKATSELCCAKLCFTSLNTLIFPNINTQELLLYFEYLNSFTRSFYTRLQIAVLKFRNVWARGEPIPGVGFAPEPALKAIFRHATPKSALFCQNQFAETPESVPLDSEFPVPSLASSTLYKLNMSIKMS